MKVLMAMRHQDDEAGPNFLDSILVLLTDRDAGLWINRWLKFSTDVRHESL